MKTYAPDYYTSFRCIADKCRHTCCKGWEIDIDEISLQRMKKIPDISKHIQFDDTPHIILNGDESCPFLNARGLCDMILTHGEDMLCDICRDHPRFRNFWSDRIEIGLGLVCEEAARIILSSPTPLKLIEIENDGVDDALPDDEKWLLDYRDDLLANITAEGCRARLLEYLIYRHIPDALYDDRLEQRVSFVYSAYDELIGKWEKTSGTLDDLIEICRVFSYDVEYDDEVLEEYIENEGK